MSTLSPVVAAIGGINFEGNIIPHSWYNTPLLQTVPGKPNLVAMVVLSDILYWYRPTTVRDEDTGRTVDIKQKFRADKLQKDYKLWAEQFGLSKGQLQDAVGFLRHKGLITVELRTITSGSGVRCGNVVFIEPVVDVIRSISSLPTLSRKIGIGDVVEKETPSPEKSAEVSRKIPTPLPKNRETNTENTTETISENSPEITKYESSSTTAGCGNTNVNAGKPASDDVQSFKKREYKPSGKKSNLTEAERKSANELLVRLTAPEIDFTYDQAVRIIKEYGVEAVRQQTDWLKYRDAKEPAGCLRRSIEQNWPAPQAIKVHQEREATLRREREAREINRVQHQKEQAKKQEETDRIETFWNSLSTGEQEEVMVDAKERLCKKSTFYAQKLRSADAPSQILKTQIDVEKLTILLEKISARSEQN